MTRLQKTFKVFCTGVGVLGGAVIFYYHNNKHENPFRLSTANAWSTAFTHAVKWDHNWDRRDPKSLIKPIKIKSESDANKYNEKLEQKKTRAARHLILIRHGQYNLKGETDGERYLTELGKIQADTTGKRLAELNLPYSLIVRSTLTRAQETSKIIEKTLPTIETKDDPLLIEGCPIPPEPFIGSWRPDSQYYADGARIEAGFRKYFHRADPCQEKDSYTVLVCHANVIRYFVCRALQFPPEAWLRISLNHASITWLTIQPSGRVTLRCLGETGHMEPEIVTPH
ncbi:serine/threonine-protein phosphatase PGAM5, mitochondrial-like [Prorops nasuta]|uniref:serine/threonine-protein phosphatase PGAM5, mitochondrial-like n=1 Tax=Prorops nasuta TaxID=863751 RepID=UPI0034CD0B6A